MKLTADNFYAGLANTIRLRCLILLAREQELCVCELTHALDLAQPVISRHLALLRETGLVLDRREGIWIHYRLHPDLPQWAQSVLTTTAEGVLENMPFADDHLSLCDMPNRPGARCCA